MHRLLLVLLVACSGGEPPPPPPAAPAPKPKPKKAAQDTAPPTGPNSPPVLSSITFEPSKPTTNDAVRAVVKASDRDGDRVDVDYKWFINGQERYEFRNEVLPARAIEKGDVVVCEVDASDGERETSRTSKELTIANTAPRFVSDPRAMKDIDGFRVEATDDDGDKLKFSLQGAPDGMTVDKDLGVLRYKGTVDEPGGQYRIKVVANDGDGGKAGWDFGIELSPGSAAAKKAKGKK